MNLNFLAEIFLSNYTYSVMTNISNSFYFFQLTYKNNVTSSLNAYLSLSMSSSMQSTANTNANCNGNGNNNAANMIRILLLSINRIHVC